METKSSINQTLMNIIKNTSKNAFKTITFMLKIIIPVTFIVKLLQYLDFLKYITVAFEPLMKFFGLSGDAALVLITSNVINIYGGLAVMNTLSFSVKEVTILAVMILFSHSLLIESAIIKGLNVPIKKQLILRISAAIFSGLTLNLMIGNRYSEVAFTSTTQSVSIPKISFSSFDLFSNWLMSLLSNYFQSILNTTISIVWIITAVLLGLEILKELKILDKINNLSYHLTKHLGLTKSATSSLIVGLFIGITYGAGAILVHYKEGKLNKRDVSLVTTFLLLCHAIIEDVFLFIKHGAIPWIILPYKIILTIIVAYIYKLILNKKSKEINKTTSNNNLIINNGTA